MKPEQAWQAALGQLQREMPKATFDTWVRGAELVTYEDETFAIGVATDYTREWLEGRLSSTITRLLTGLMNCSVEVRFITWQSPQEGENEAEPDGAPGISEAQKQLTLQIAHASLRDAIIQPDKVVVIPGYFRRWLPYLGPSLAWIVVAFRQAMYLATRREAKPGIEFNVSPASVARWAGISRATLYRHLDDWMLGWFLKRTSRESNTFQFTASIPLTPGDAEFLHAWLVTAGVQEDPIGVLQKALDIFTATALPTPPSVPTREHLDLPPDPHSVQEVVLAACRRMDKATLAKVMELADRLAAQIQPAGDKIYITHYFLLNHLAKLGPAPAWFVTLLRDRCYIAKNEVRDAVWITGGYPEIARMLGLSRAKTINEWLPPVVEHKSISRPPKAGDPDIQTAYQYRTELRDDVRAIVSQFIGRTEYLQGSGVAAWNFKVSMIEPLLPEHQTDYNWAIDLLHRALEANDGSEIESRLGEVQGACNRAQMLPGRGANETPWYANETIENDAGTRMKHDGTRMRPGRYANETPWYANETGVVRERDTVVREWDALNTLNTLNKLFKHLQTNTLNTPAPEVVLQTGPAEPGSGRAVGSTWELPVLFVQNRTIRPGLRDKILESGVAAQTFVSWCLYASSPAGDGITKPAQFAACKVAETGAGAGSAYDRLAALPPQQLRLLIEGCSCEVPAACLANWNSVMKGAKPESLLTLRDQLFGP